MKLSNLTTHTGHYLSRHRYGDLPASYLFVETVVGSGILSETGTNYLNSMVNAAIGKLQNFMTPGASTDLETMLWFVTRNSDSLVKVKQAIAKAGTLQVPIHQDQNWWQEVFNIFNLKDQGIQQQIKDKTIQGVGQAPSQQAPAQQAPAQQTPAQQTPAQQAPAQADQTPSDEPVLGDQEEIKDKLSKNAAARKASMDNIRNLYNQIATRAKKTGGTTLSPTVEDIFNIIATNLINEADVKSNLKFVASNLMRRLGYASTTPVQEINWLKKFVHNFERPQPVTEGFRDFFNNLRTAIANPGHAQMQSKNSELKNYNERAAKLAIRYMTDWLTAEINARLQVAGLTYQDMATSLAEWRRLLTINNSGKAPPGTAQQLKAAQDRVLKIVYALDPKLATGGGIGTI